MRILQNVFLAALGIAIRAFCVSAAAKATFSIPEYAYIAFEKVAQNPRNLPRGPSIPRYWTNGPGADS
jgi:hypothetical protein